MVALRFPPAHPGDARRARAARCRRRAAAHPPTSRPGGRRSPAARRPPSAGPRTRARAGAASRDRLEEAPPGGEGLASGRGVAARCVRADQRREPACEPVASAAPRRPARPRRASRPRPRAVGLEDARLGLDDLAERPERDPVAVGQAPALPPATRAPGARRRSRNSATRRLLPTPGSPGQRHELERAAPSNALARALQQRQLVLAARRTATAAASSGRRRSGPRRDARARAGSARPCP